MTDRSLALLVLPLVAGAIAFAGMLVPLPSARAEGSRNWRPQTDAVVIKECGACHMAFPSGMLPAASWARIMARLDDHFGENAHLDEATAKHVGAVLAAGAADAGRPVASSADQALAKALPRITETAWWRRDHEREVSPSAFVKAGSKAACTTCHADAARGVFEDD